MVNENISHSSLPGFSPSTALCPLCDGELDLDVSIYRVSAKWRDAFLQRDKWIVVAAQFRAHQSIEVAAQSLSITPALALYLLRFLCTEICGCRTVICVSCLDDYRTVL
jgi:hypothetical protein